LNRSNVHAQLHGQIAHCRVVPLASTAQLPVRLLKISHRWDSILSSGGGVHRTGGAHDGDDDADSLRRVHADTSPGPLVAPRFRVLLREPSRTR